MEEMKKKRLALNLWLKMKVVGLFVCELRVGGSEYGERLTEGGFFMGMEKWWGGESV